MPTTHVNGSDLHYLDEGPPQARDVLVLLHAFPLHSGMWAPQVATFRRRCRLIAPDYRGLGRTPPSGEPSTMALLAEDVRGLLTHLRVERAVVVGLSMGGYVALELFRQLPGLFRGLALCDTRAGADTEEGRAGRETFAKTALERGLAWVADDMVPKLLRDGADAAVTRTVRDLVVHSGTPAGVAAAQRGMAARPDSTLTLSRIACPAIVVRGEGDKIVPREVAEKLAAGLPHGKLVEIPGAGHLPNLENPEAFDRALSDLVDGSPA